MGSKKYNGRPQGATLVGVRCISKLIFQTALSQPIGTSYTEPGVINQTRTASPIITLFV